MVTSIGTFTGIFDDGVPGGKGIFEDKESGSLYAGVWTNGVLNGEATITYKDGKVFSGTVADSKRTAGKVSDPKSSYLYEGTFSDDKFSGVGALTDA